MLNDQLLLRQVRAHQVDYVAFPFDYRDPLNMMLSWRV